MIKARLFLIAAFLFQLGMSQNAEPSRTIDSLILVINAAKEDSNKVNSLDLLGSELMYNNPDTAIILANQALEISEKIAWKRGIAKSLLQLGLCNWIKGEFPKALEYYFSALKIQEELNNKSGIVQCLANIGNIYYNQDDYPKAINYHLRALKMDEERGNKKGIARHLGNIGNVYNAQRDFPKALDYYDRALKLNEELGNKIHAAACLGNIGNVYNELGDFSKSLDYYLRALKMKEELGNKTEIAITLGNIGSLYTSTKNYKEAEKYLVEALKMNREIGAQHIVWQVEESLSELYTKMDKHQLALTHYKNAMALKDTLFNEEKNKELVEKEMNFDFEKKQAATKAEQDKKDTVTRIIIYSVSAGLALVLVLALFIFRGYRQKQRANTIIHEQKLILEEKQKDILDSIHYAKRIQQGLLPTDIYIHKTLKKLID